MKTPKYNQMIGTALLAAGTAVCGQSTVSSDKSATAPAPSAPSQAVAAPATNSFVRLDGNDLHIGSLPPITFHGFFSQGFLGSSDYNYLGNTTAGSFNFTEMGVNATFSPFNHARIAVQGFAFDVGNVGNYDPFLDYASLDYSISEALGLRVGRIRRPDGIYNDIQDIDLARTYVLLPQSVYDPRWRDFYTSVDGGSIYGNLNLSKAGALSYEASAGMTSVSQQGGLARYYESALSVKPGTALEQVNDCFFSGAQVWWNTPLSGLRAGANFSYASDLEIDYRATVNTPAGSRTFGMVDKWNVPMVQGSIEYLNGPWTLQAEYMSRNNSVTTTRDGEDVSSLRRRAEGWYVAAAYRFNRRFETGIYYGEFYNNASDRTGSTLAVPSDGYQDDLALSFRFDPEPWWVLKLEGHCMHGTALVRDNVDNPVRNGDTWYMLALKTTFSF